MYCDNCGKSIPDNARACGYCGQVYAKEAAAAPSFQNGGPGSGVPAGARYPSGWSGLVLSPARKILETLERGSVIRATVAMALRILAILFVLGGIFLLIETLKMSFSLPTAQGTVGGLIFAASLAAMIAASCQVLLYRAESITSLGESLFTVIPILSILLRAVGEIYAVIGIAIGVGGCLFLWFSGESPLRMLGGMAPFFLSGARGGTFLDGLVLLAWSGLGSFGLLLFCYFLAESILIMADIARNVRLLVKASGSTSKP